MRSIVQTTLAEFSPHSPDKARTACTPHEKFRHKKGKHMTQRDNHITTDTPTAFAVTICVGRMIRYISPEDAKNLIPQDKSTDDLIHATIRMMINDCRKFLAHWVGHGVLNGRYEITGRTWISRDGLEWIDASTSEPVDGEEFDNASITLMGGPLNGEVIE